MRGYLLKFPHTRRHAQTPHLYFPIPLSASLSSGFRGNAFQGSDLRLTSHLREEQEEEKRRLGQAGSGEGKKESEEVLIGSLVAAPASQLNPSRDKMTANKTRLFRLFFTPQWDNRRCLDTAFLWAGGDEHDIGTKNYLL